MPLTSRAVHNVVPAKAILCVS